MAHYDNVGHSQRYKHFHNTYHRNVLPPKPPSPLPGTEEYAQRNIQQTSDLIKRQLNIDSETCCEESVVKAFSISATSVSDGNSDVQSEQVPVEHEQRKNTKQLTKLRSKIRDEINVQEIHDKIIKHISNLSYSKKLNLVNQGSVAYDIAIQELQKQKRLELTQALREMSKRDIQNSNDGEVINAIIPDIGLKIEDLPKEVMAELSSTLNTDLMERIVNPTDSGLCFKQNQELLGVDLPRGDFNCNISESLNNFAAFQNQDQVNNLFEFDYLNKPMGFDNTNLDNIEFTSYGMNFSNDPNHCPDENLRGCNSLMKGNDLHDNIFIINHVLCLQCK